MRKLNPTQQKQLVEAGIHISATTHADNISVTRDLRPCDCKINGFPGLIVEHFYVTFGDPSCTSFRDIVRKTDRQTDRQTNADDNPTPATAVDVVKHTFVTKYTVTQNKHNQLGKNKTKFRRLLRPPTWKGNEPFLKEVNKEGIK